MKLSVIFLPFILIAGFLNTSCSVFGIRSEEQPGYTVLQKFKNKEIRQYQPYIIAKTTVYGSYKQVQKQGFRKLAGYIFGKNKARQKIAMTAPVTQQKQIKNQKISMTAPVIIRPSKGLQENSWVMTFSMPAKYTLETLPVPDDKDIVLEEVPSRLVAALIFSGFWNQKKNDQLGQELITWLDQQNKFQLVSKPMFAGYNPPWTLPFLRRNEILIEIKKSN